MSAAPAVLEVLMNRRSDRHFADRPLEPGVAEALFEAFRWAPSSNNRQPWRLLVAQSPEATRAWDDALSEGNRAWATLAPLKLVLVGHPAEQADRDGLQCFMLDCGLALENLLVQGCAMGLTAHAMVGWDAAKVVAGFAIPAPMRPVALVAVGYRGRVEDLAPAVREKDLRPRTRRPVDEIVIRDRFPSA